PLIVFENNFDGDRLLHWRKVVGVFGQELRDIFACSKASRDPSYKAAFDPSQFEAALIAFLEDHVAEPAAYHIGSPGMTVDRIKREQVLMDEVQNYLDLNQNRLQSQAPVEIHDTVRRALISNPRFSWLDESEGRVALPERLRNWVAALPFILLVVGLAIALPAAAIWAVSHYGWTPVTAALSLGAAAVAI